MLEVGKWYYGIRIFRYPTWAMWSEHLFKPEVRLSFFKVKERLPEGAYEQSVYEKSIIGFDKVWVCPITLYFGIKWEKVK